MKTVTVRYQVNYGDVGGDVGGVVGGVLGGVVGGDGKYNSFCMQGCKRHCIPLTNFNVFHREIARISGLSSSNLANLDLISPANEQSRVILPAHIALVQVWP